MTTYLISEAAARDIETIVEFTMTAFGKFQAISYHASIERTFQILAEFPRIGRPTFELMDGLYRFPHKAHVIFYTGSADHILIARVLPARADFKRAF